MTILGICSSTRSLQTIGKLGFQTCTYIVTDIATFRLNEPRGRFSENDYNSYDQNDSAVLIILWSSAFMSLYRVWVH